MKFLKQSLIAFLLFPLLTFAQPNFKPGYVVNLKGDTLRGEIDLREWDGSPTSIKFKFPDNSIKKLTAHDIRFFNVNNQAEYQRYEGPISTDPVNPNKMIGERDTSFRIDTIFLEILQKGPHVALYSYSDHIKQRFFIGESPEFVPTELVYRLYYDADKVKYGRTVNEDTYQKQLFALLEKYNLVSEAVMRDFTWMNYREDDLVRMVSRINDFKKKKANKKH